MTLCQRTNDRLNQTKTKMKQILIITLLLVAFNSYAKYYPGTLTFKNGKSRDGFIDSNLGNVILFKGWMEAPQPEEISAASIKTVWIKTNAGHKMNEYHYLLVDKSKDGSSWMWLKQVEKGGVTLFVYETLLPQDDGSDKAEVLYFYCLREGKEMAKLIATRNNNLFFISKASEFFADKPELVEKIQSKQYTWENVQELVYAYNHSM